MVDKGWSVYLIETSCGKLYCGISKDPERRFKEHRDSTRGAKYFRGKSPKSIVWVESDHSQSSALKREFQIKKMSRKDKESLIKKRGANLP